MVGLSAVPAIIQEAMQGLLGTIKPIMEGLLGPVFPRRWSQGQIPINTRNERSLVSNNGVFLRRSIGDRCLRNLRKNSQYTPFDIDYGPTFWESLPNFSCRDFPLDVKLGIMKPLVLQLQDFFRERTLG